MFLPGRTFIRLICYSLRGKQTKKEIVFGGEGGEIRRLLLAQKIYRPEDYFLSLTSGTEK